jgi:hypothetical protein
MHRNVRFSDVHKSNMYGMTGPNSQYSNTPYSNVQASNLQEYRYRCSRIKQNLPGTQNESKENILYSDIKCSGLRNILIDLRNLTPTESSESLVPYILHNYRDLFLNIDDEHQICGIMKYVNELAKNIYYFNQVLDTLKTVSTIPTSPKHTTIENNYNHKLYLKTVGITLCKQLNLTYLLTYFNILSLKLDYIHYKSLVEYCLESIMPPSGCCVHCYIMYYYTHLNFKQNNHLYRESYNIQTLYIKYFQLLPCYKYKISKSNTEHEALQNILLVFGLFNIIQELYDLENYNPALDFDMISKIISDFMNTDFGRGLIADIRYNPLQPNSNSQKKYTLNNIDEHIHNLIYHNQITERINKVSKPKPVYTMIKYSYCRPNKHSRKREVDYTSDDEDGGPA